MTSNSRIEKKKKKTSTKIYFNLKMLRFVFAVIGIRPSEESVLVGDGLHGCD